MWYSVELINEKPISVSSSRGKCCDVLISSTERNLNSLKYMSVCVGRIEKKPIGVFHFYHMFLRKSNIMFV